MGQQDTQQVCLNGHQTTDSYHRSPHLRKIFCVTCGAKTIHQCPNCGAQIKGDYYYEGIIAVGYSTPVPTHCENCGLEFPWTRSNAEQLSPAAVAPGVSDLETSHFGLVEKICSRFHLVAKRISARHAGRTTLLINDEYDVQDLLHGMLHIFFDDIRSEEWTPSYAGGGSRVDFLLKNEKIVIEVKKTRATLKAKDVGEELIIDSQRYRSHPDCKKLFCFVYDPEELISNPRGLESDLNRKEEDFEVKVLIVPKGH